MFKFLKDKLKKAVDKISKSAAEDVIEEQVDEKAIEEAKQKEAAKKKPAVEIEDTEAAKNHRERHKDDNKPITKPSKPVKTQLVSPTPKKTEKKKSLSVKEEPKVVDEPAVEEKTADKKIIEQPVFDKKEKVIEVSKEEISGETKSVSQPEKKKSFFGKVFGKKEESVTSEKKPELTPEPTPEIIKEPVEATEPEQPERSSEPEEPDVEEKPKGFFDRVSDRFTKKRLTQEKFEELFWDLEMTLLENNVAIEVIEKIKHDMQRDLTEGTVTRKGIDQLIIDSLRESIESLFIEPYNLVDKIKQSDKRPYVITVIGVNGSGKTTSLAKIANLFHENDLSVVMAASDTFRAAAIDQLKEHANMLGIKLISQGYGADPAAVAFDAIKHAEARQIDVVLIDTAGRLHSNTNLMAELEKVVRVAKPDLKIFVGESITGNDCVEQATEFNKAVGIDAIILSKADVDEKGGAAISVSFVTGCPILYLGVGQAYGDLQPFDSHRIIKSLGLA